ncbi:hypothetical protein MRX96_017915 [Rhipicephalus microplus]
MEREKLRHGREGEWVHAVGGAGIDGHFLPPNYPSKIRMQGPWCAFIEGTACTPPGSSGPAEECPRGAPVLGSAATSARCTLLVRDASSRASARL